jgi:DNA polymerase-1
MYDLYNNIELPLVEVLASMEYIGIRTDGDYLRTLSEYFNSELTVTTKQIFDFAGESFNINSPKQLGEILFEKLKLPSKGNGSTSVDILEKLKDYPIVDKVLYYRTLSKLNSTYAQGLLSKIDSDGRIHSNFKQTVTATGRISSTEPNLQNIPIRTEIGRRLRKAFIPNEGYTLLSGDYSQIELRVLSHIAQDKNMINAFNHDADIHTITASEVFKTPIDKVTKAQRQAAKAVNFGIIYGISDFSLAKDINVSVKEASKYINDYLDFYSGIRSYMTEIVQQAKTDGFVTTIYGRRRYLPELNSPKFSVREFGKRVALNAPIQGSAADIIKIAMVNIYNALKVGKYRSRLILQVHDELIIETHLDEVDSVKELLIKYMTDHFRLSVPLKIDFSIGNSLLKD